MGNTSSFKASKEIPYLSKAKMTFADIVRCEMLKDGPQKLTKTYSTMVRSRKTGEIFKVSMDISHTSRQSCNSPSSHHQISFNSPRVNGPKE
jgi:hypothetical protein